MDIVTLAAELAVLAVLFSLIEHFFRGLDRKPWFKRPDMKTDLAYFFFNSLTNPVLQALSILAAAMGIATLGGASMAQLRELLRAAFQDDTLVLASVEMQAWISSFPLWVQILTGLLIADFFAYWGHRIFHKKPFWYMHAIHHSPPTLDWLSSIRFHPLEDAVMAVLQVLPLILLGYPPEIFVIVTPTIALWATLSHANVTWDFGPLKYLIITPRFHRWHHTSESEGIDKNFGGIFSFYDILFGTWYMPKDKVPTRFGAGGTPVPAGFWKQIAFPFRWARDKDRLARDER